MKHQGHYQTRGFDYFMRQEAMYFIVMLPENNPGWHQKCFYVKDQPTSSRKIGLEEFRAVSDLWARQSWETPYQQRR
jgi:hypothetical protein